MILNINAYLDETGTLVITTQMSVLTPKAITELDLRQKIVKGIADAYLDHFNMYNNDPDGREELEFLWRLYQNRPSFADQRNPKSTENENEII